MNRLTKLDAPQWDVVHNDTYVMTEDDFPDGCFVVTDAHTGLQTATGRTKFGMEITKPLGVPLCGGCDEPVGRDGLCANCQIIHVIEAYPLGDGRWGVGS